MIKKARATAIEHTGLSQRLASGYDADAAKREGALRPIAEAFRDWERASESLRELKALIQDSSTEKELRELAKEDSPDASERLKNASRAVTTALVPRHPFAHLPCLVEIRPGAGGAEAALFAGELLRMYQAFCSRRNLRANLLKYEDQAGVSDSHSSDAPLQEAILEVSSSFSYDLLRTEAGVHRVQRVPATESKGRVHTSAVNVLVMPSLPPEEASEADFSDPNSDYFVSSADVRVDVMRAGGAGGQHVNKTESAVRMTHVPTNIVAMCSESRSQLQNRQKAWQLLRARISQQRREAREQEMLAFRRNTTGHGKFGRGDKVRTYNWSQQRVTDHRSGLNIHQLDDVVDGGKALDTVIESVRAWMLDQEIEHMISNPDA